MAPVLHCDNILTSIGIMYLSGMGGLMASLIEAIPQQADLKKITCRKPVVKNLSKSARSR
jgi:hypothetical protein